MKHLDFEPMKYLGSFLADRDKYPFMRTYFQGLEVREHENYYLTNKEKGIGAIYNEDQVLKVFQIYFNGMDGLPTFQGALPKGITARDSPEDVLQKLDGIDYESGGGKAVAVLGIDSWWKYHFQNGYLHVTFKDEKILRLMSLGMDFK